MIRIKGITVAFGGVKPLRELSFQLSGAICGLIGPNGAGKTTLVNVLSGFVTPVAGEAEAFGTRLLDMRPEARHAWGLARSFQTPQIADDLSVAENVMVALDPLRLPGAERSQRLAMVLAETGLAPRAHVQGRRLDGFDRRLVELARCKVSRPRLILLDEPAAGLAATERAQLIDLIRALPVPGESMVLIIDHDIDLIAAICEQTAVLDFGTLVACGTTRDVLADPKVRAAYLGELEEGTS